MSARMTNADQSPNAGSPPAMTARSLYFPLLNIDEHYNYLGEVRIWLEAALTDAVAEPSAPQLPSAIADRAAMQVWCAAAQAWRAGLVLHIAERLGQAPASTAHQWLTQCAPLAVVDGCLLQYISSAATSHGEAEARLLGSYIASVGDADPAWHCGNLYLDLLRSAAVALPNASSPALARDGRIADAMFEMPVFQLALSLFPRTLMPELLGANLFNAILGAHPIIEWLAPAIMEAFGPSRYLATVLADSRRVAAIDAALAAIEAYFAALEPDERANAGECWQRMRRGFAAANGLHDNELAALAALHEAAAFTAAARMADLVRRKAGFAFGYHKHPPLGGKVIDDWFKPDAFDAAAFLDALARSPYVRAGDPARSALTTTAIAARGPMAGIFNREEVGIIDAWIRGLPNGQTAPQSILPLTITTLPQPPSVEPAQSSKAYAKLPVRELYFYLLHMERFPDVLSFAKSFAALWLSRAGQALEKGTRPIPFARYDHAALDAWLVQEHSHQVSSYVHHEAPPMPTREEVIDSSVQLCPMVFIDGAWLQRICNVAYCGTAVGARLLRIYLDEVGNGSAKENHPNVYRELMREMGVDLPTFGSMEFCRWSGFKDSAFLVPTFWLCISQFPKNFLPEILGLNLAMELSGVGGSYRNGSDILRHYGFTPTFVDLHNTVDNASTGHSAIALEAIKIHMDEMLERGGFDEVQRRWKRVWTGYRALTPPAGYA